MSERTFADKRGAKSSKQLAHQTTHVVRVATTHVE